MENKIGTSGNGKLVAQLISTAIAMSASGNYYTSGRYSDNDDCDGRRHRRASSLTGTEYKKRKSHKDIQKQSRKNNRRG